MIDAPVVVKSLLASRPKEQFIAHLFTFKLATGTTYRYTDARLPITLGGNTFPATAQKFIRGRISASRGTSIDSHQVQINEQNGAVLQAIEYGFWDLAIYTLQRVFAASATSPWIGPVTRFVGQVSSVDEIGFSYAKLSVKSMLNVLDNDFPRTLIQTDCSNVLFSPQCGLSRATYQQTGTVAAGTTGNTILTNLSAADDYFDQGIIRFTSGALNGYAYMVKKSLNASGKIFPAYPLMSTPAAGDTFTISPGCDKTLATCQSKYGLASSSGNPPYFRGMPFVPDPTASY